MKTRVLAAMLWFFAGWYIGSYISVFFAITPYVGPVIGTAAAALFAGDPRRIIWSSRARVAASTSMPEHYRPI